MNYSILAEEFLDKMEVLRKAKPHKHIEESLHGEALVLHFIAVRSDETLPGEIGQKMNVSSARIAQTLNRIEKKGWITREIDVNDRRKIIVKLTPEGKAEEESYRRTVVDKTAEMLRLLGEDDAREYVRLTKKLAEAMALNTET